MAKTHQNLKAAFAGESQANRKYLAFAEKADKEGFKQVAKLFRAAADGETRHAMNHFNTMHGVKSTAENLNEAMNGEHYEFTTMYPEFIKTAKKEGDKDAVETFEEAYAVEKVHHVQYKKALESVKQGKDLPKTEYWVCQHCGNLFVGTIPEICPVCKHPKKEFKKIE
ncbi:MAG: rubrerythrin family protein [Candidatus Nanoarchaeia archaeon]